MYHSIPKKALVKQEKFQICEKKNSIHGVEDDMKEKEKEKI